MSNSRNGLIDNWLRNIKDVYQRYAHQFEGLTKEARVDRLCEYNVIEQVKSVCHTGIVQDAWDRGQTLSVHGWIYSIDDGLLKDLDVCIEDKGQIDSIYQILAR